MPKFQPGNQAAKGHGKGRPRLEVISLADEAALEVLEADIAVLQKAKANPRSVSKLERHRAKERISRMCRGRVPTRIAITVDGDDPNPIPFSCVMVASTPPDEDKGGQTQA